MFISHILYWFFVGLLIYSVVVIPVFIILGSVYEDDYPPTWKRFWVEYGVLWPGFFRLLSPGFRKPLNFLRK